MAGKGKTKGAARKLRPATQLVHGGILRSSFGENSEALFLTQSYVYDTAEQAERRFKGEDPGFIYSRYANPTVAMFEERIRLLEGAEVARATATGMAAVTAGLLSFLKAGDHIVAARAMFGSCRYIVETLCPRFGIAMTLIDGRDIENWKAAVRPNTKAFFFETPANPTLDLVDIGAVAALAKEHGITTVVDNVFATPMLLGGPTTVLFPETISSFFHGASDKWPVGAAFAMIMLMTALATAGIFMRLVGGRSTKLM